MNEKMYQYFSWFKVTVMNKHASPNISAFVPMDCVIKHTLKKKKTLNESEVRFRPKLSSRGSTKQRELKDGFPKLV